MPSGCSPPKLAGPGSALERPCHCLEGNGCGCAPTTVGSSQGVAKRPCCDNGDRPRARCLRLIGVVPMTEIVPKSCLPRTWANADAFSLLTRRSKVAQY